MNTLEQLKETYKGKKVFLTGHTGFKGSWLLILLNYLQAEVVGYALAPEQDEAIYNAINGDTKCQSIIHDIRDKDFVKKSIKEAKPDFIFHLAAQPLVRDSYEDPCYTYETNAMGTAYVLDAIRALEIACASIIITTDKVYDNKEWIYPYREEDRLGGFDPYSSSKALAEIIVDSFRKSYQLPENNKGVATARAGNVIGGGDFAKDRIIPDIIRSIQNSVPVNLRNPKAIRPWQHVIEPLVGYLMLGTKLEKEPLKYSQAYNFGPYSNDILTVQELAVCATEVIGKGEVVVKELAEQPHEANLLMLDISKANQGLNWSPKYNSKKAIEVTMEWYNEISFKGSDAYSFSMEQIEKYFALEKIH